jgi:bifunctional DNA-binding transcriptional regulator/antitoxin component of YhaV-PrlF toxin-antitoxin module
MEKNKNVRKLTRQGRRSIGVILPIEMVRQLGWRKKQRVTVRRIKGGMVIRDYKNRR